MGRLDWSWTKRILAFYPMLIVHSLVPPLALILVRGMAIESIGPEATGQWQAALRISETYLGLVMTSTGLYFMPQLGTVINSPYRLQREVRTTLAITVSATAAIAAIIYLLRVPIVHIVFSGAFVDVAGLMPVQLIGDTLTMIGWTLGYVLVALVRSAWYIVLQFLIPLVFYATTRWLIADHGAHAIVIGYAISGGVHAVLGCFALREILFRRVQLPVAEGGKN